MKVYSENRKVSFDYEILEKFEGGLVLIGQEVKSIKNGRINLTGSYIILKGGEAFLVGCKIPAYQPKNAPSDYREDRDRKLLLHKKEINYLSGKLNQKGFSLIPLKVYEKNGKIKIEFGLAKGKKKYEKREKLKKRDIEREIARELSSWG